MAKYALAISSLKGIQTKNDAQDVQEFLFLVREYRTHFEQNGHNRADILYESVFTNLQEFSNEKEPTIQKQLGSKILFEINGFTAVIKKVIDSKLQNLNENSTALVEKTNSGNLLQN